MRADRELRVLMLEDLEDDARLLDRALTKENIHFTRIRVATRKDFTKALDDFAPDIILSDHGLPQFDSLEALKIVKEKKIEAPFIIVTGTVSEEFAVSCLKKGADDYILKSNLARLPSAIKHSLQEHENSRIRKEQEQTLQRQNEELIKINKELDSFVYSISHNLRSPLASVIGVVNVAKLDENKSKDVSDRYFDLIGKSTQKLDEVLKEILSYSQNSRTDLDVSVINLKELVDEAFDSLTYLKGSSVIDRQFHINEDVPFYSDSHRLSILLTNLLSNAIKYKNDNESHPFIRIQASITPALATIEILDNGVGITPYHLPEIFKMFFRANEKSDGAGLGLYIVKEVIEKLQGTIEITSEYEQWTHIKITLPNISVGVFPTAGL